MLPSNVLTDLVVDEFETKNLSAHIVASPFFFEDTVEVHRGIICLLNRRPVSIPRRCFEKLQKEAVEFHDIDCEDI